MNKLMVVIRKKSQHQLEVVERELCSQSGAEAYAQELYHDLQLDTVMVVELDRVQGLNCTMKIVRSCKHPNIQGDFIAGGFLCTNCGMVFKPSPQPKVVELISNIEITPDPLLQPLAYANAIC